MAHSKMICPKCNVAMNHHAEKVDVSAAVTNPDAVDPDFGGIVEEAHTCPACGESAVRRAG